MPVVGIRLVPPGRSDHRALWGTQCANQQLLPHQVTTTCFLSEWIQRVPDAGPATCRRTVPEHRSGHFHTQGSTCICRVDLAPCSRPSLCTSCVARSPRGLSRWQRAPPASAPAHALVGQSPETQVWAVPQPPGHCLPVLQAGVLPAASPTPDPTLTGLHILIRSHSHLHVPRAPGSVRQEETVVATGGVQHREAAPGRVG